MSAPQPPQRYHRQPTRRPSPVRWKQGGTASWAPAVPAKPPSIIIRCAESALSKTSFRVPLAGMADDPPPDESAVRAAVALAWLSNSAPTSPAVPRYTYGMHNASPPSPFTRKGTILRPRIRSAFEAGSEEDLEEGEWEEGEADDDDDDDQDPDEHEEQHHDAPRTTPGTTTTNRKRTWPRLHSARGLPTHFAHGRRTQLVIVPWPRYDRGTARAVAAEGPAKGAGMPTDDRMHAQKNPPGNFCFVHCLIFSCISFPVPVSGATWSRSVLPRPHCPRRRHRPRPDQVNKHIKVVRS